MTDFPDCFLFLLSYLAVLQALIEFETVMAAALAKAVRK